MKSGSSRLSAAFFFGTLLCFLLPFVTVSCGGQRVATFTGVQLATGTTVEQPQMFGPPKTQRVSPDPFAAAAGLLALGATVISAVGIKRAVVVPALCGAGGAASLLLMKLEMDAQINSQSHGVLQPDYEPAFYLALLLLGAGAVWNFHLFSRRSKPTPSYPVASTARPSQGALPPQMTVAFCAKCGSAVLPGSKFCGACGFNVG